MTEWGPRVLNGLVIFWGTWTVVAAGLLIHEVVKGLTKPR